MANLGNQIGGGFVTRPFFKGSEYLPNGTPLTADEIKSFSNHKRLIASNFIKVYPPHDTASASEQRHVVHCGGGNFDVIAGRKLNDKPLMKDEAHALAKAGAH